MGREECGARAETVISAVKEITMGYGREVRVVLGNALQSLKAAEAGGVSAPIWLLFPEGEVDIYGALDALSNVRLFSKRSPSLSLHGSLDETHGFKDKDEK